MDHKALIASLTPDQRRELLKQNDRDGLIRLAGHSLALVVTGTLIMTGAPLWPLALLVHGVLLVFLFTLMHETIHNTAFKTNWINTAVSSVIGFVLILPAKAFRYFHFAHHRFTNDPDQDPELLDPRPETFAQYVIYLSGLPTWYFHIRTLINNAINPNTDSFVPTRAKAKIRHEAQIHCLIYLALLVLSIVFQSTLLIWIWLLPKLVGQPFLRAYLLAEHTLCPNVSNMLANSRTTLTGWLIRRLAWNMPYHAEHHAYPPVPFHQLPAFHRLTRAHLEVVDKGYVSVHRKIAATLQASN